MSGSRPESLEETQARLAALSGASRERAPQTPTKPRGSGSVAIALTASLLVVAGVVVSVLLLAGA